MSSVRAPENLLDPGLCLTLYDMFRDGIKNTWTVERSTSRRTSLITPVPHGPLVHPILKSDESRQI